MGFFFLSSSFPFPIALVVYLPAGLDPRIDELVKYGRGLSFMTTAVTSKSYHESPILCIYTVYLIRE